MRILLFIFSAFLISFSVSAQEESDLYGTWLTPDKNAKIKFYKANNGKVYGKIVWLEEPKNEDGTTKKDVENPDKSLRDREIMGLKLFKAFEYKGKLKWEDGTVYDAESGKTYSCEMELKDMNTLKVRGYVGISMLGRTETFTRAEKK